jgi:predicted nucleic acid-binding protein
LDDFDRDWRRSFLHASITGRLVQFAGDLAEKHALSGFDSVHLASALRLHQKLRDEMQFSGWDRDLVNAAQSEGIALAH